MVATSVIEPRPGPLERTALELEHHRRAAAFRRARELGSRRRLRESDLLLEHVEECRLRNLVPLPTSLWVRIARFVGSVDPALRDELGIHRHPDHAGDILFAAQEELLRLHLEAVQPRLAPIIPLFGARQAASA
ncbi:MAG TPA: hypothetical protein VI316_11150 [Candidatus Dormibacteraeota bacterium]